VPVNSRRLRVAARKTLSDAVISTGTPTGPDTRILSECKALMESRRLRRTGSAAIDLAWVAAGRFDGYVEHNLQAWDVAAGILLVREAGGFATDVDGGQRMFDTGSIVAGNQVVHRALLEVLAGAGRESAAAERPTEG
jgi:myo-inositol-1(or 4)-monophosphatase